LANVFGIHESTCSFLAIVLVFRYWFLFLVWQQFADIDLRFWKKKKKKKKKDLQNSKTHLSRKYAYLVLNCGDFGLGKILFFPRPAHNVITPWQ
jgi:hypothetical protein